MVPNYLKQFSSEEINYIIAKGQVDFTTGSTGTIMLSSDMLSVTSSLMSIPIDDIEYGSAKVKNLTDYKISHYETASANFSVALNGLNQKVI